MPNSDTSWPKDNQTTDVMSRQTYVNGKYPNYQKVGKITRIRAQFVPGSSFLRAAHAESLGTRLANPMLNLRFVDFHAFCDQLYMNPYPH